MEIGHQIPGAYERSAAVRASGEQQFLASKRVVKADEQADEQVGEY